MNVYFNFNIQKHLSVIPKDYDIRPKIFITI